MAIGEKSRLAKTRNVFPGAKELRQRVGKVLGRGRSVSRKKKREIKGNEPQFREETSRLERGGRREKRARSEKAREAEGARFSLAFWKRKKKSSEKAFRIVP
jgi:hypothetical protein